MPGRHSDRRPIPRIPHPRAAVRGQERVLAENPLDPLLDLDSDLTLDRLQKHAHCSTTRLDFAVLAERLDQEHKEHTRFTISVDPVQQPG